MPFQKAFSKNDLSFNTVENQEPVEGLLQTPRAHAGQIGKCDKPWATGLWVPKKRIQCSGDSSRKPFSQLESGNQIQASLQEIPTKLLFQISVKLL